MRVCIIGAGPAGLLLALCLQRRVGVRVTLVEQRENHAQVATYDPARSYTIDLTAHGMRALEYAGVRGRLVRELIPFKGIRVSTARLAFDNAHRSGGVTGSRGDICRSLLRELESCGRDVVELRFETPATVVDADAGLVQIGQEATPRQFDLVVGADGAGSGTRAALGISIAAGAYTNHGSMIRLDVGVDALDPSWLYMLGVPPVMQVAGAINGPGGPADPLWFCQIGTDGPLGPFASPGDAERWLAAHCPRVRAHVSAESIAAFATMNAIPTGKWKVLDTFVKGRVVLVGDAAAPFPPIGQGINAALECVTVLDRCIGELPDDAAAAARRFEALWRPEAMAITSIARQLDIKVSRLRVAKTVLYTLLGLASVQNAKRAIPYSRALAWERAADAVFLGLGTALVLGLAKVVFA